MRAFEFIEHFSNLFTLNYDFLLHWIWLQDTGSFTDGFGLGEDDGEFLGPFSEEAWCNVYNVHGGLHLFSDADGAVRKRLGEPAIIEAIGKTIVEGKGLPLYVAEGTSSQKLAKIFGFSVLAALLRTNQTVRRRFFVFGDWQIEVMSTSICRFSEPT